MLEKVIDTYYKGKLSLIKEMSTNNFQIIDEVQVYDNGYLTTKVNYLKAQLEEVMNELNIAITYEKKDKYTSERIEALNRQKEELIFSMCFYASNGLNSLDMCRNMLNGTTEEFKTCIDALISYKNNEIETAFKLFHKYFSETNKIPKHYLINKIYGLISKKYGQDEMAITLLQEAAAKKPQDIEVHKMLYELYERNGLKQELEVEKIAINLLGGTL